MSFQAPIAIPGVNNVDFLRLACNARRKAKGEAELDPLEFYAYLTPKVHLSQQFLMNSLWFMTVGSSKDGSKLSEQECQ